MDTIKSTIDLIKNPYVITVITIILVIYGTLMANMVPPSLTSWLALPFVKIIFILLILLLRYFSPTLSILVALVFIILMRSGNHVNFFNTTSQSIVPAEIQQMNQEMYDALKNKQSSEEPQIESEYHAVPDINNNLLNPLVTGNQKELPMDYNQPMELNPLIDPIAKLHEY